MNQEPTRPQDPPADSRSADGIDGGMLGRRRLIKLGAGAVPASLTLVSRPVHAFACNSTSAWGSAQVNPSASVTARAALKATTIERWTLTEWVNNTTHGSLLVPWNTLGSTSSGVVTNTSKALTLGTVFPGGPYPTGLASTDLLWAILSGSAGASLFQKYMLTAMLNSKLNGATPSIGPDNCLPTAKLQSLMTGSYTVPSTGTVWDQNKIVEYLLANNLVAP